jgi:predicted kinase
MPTAVFVFALDISVQFGIVGTMKKLLVLQGLPASGKSTYARELLALAEVGTALRINNDELSAMMFGSSFAPSSNSSQLLGKVRAEIIRNSFRLGYELVIVDNTNLSPKTFKSLQRIAEDCDAEFELDNSFLDVPIEECLRRNASRENPVPENVIWEMAKLIRK